MAQTDAKRLGRAALVGLAAGLLVCSMYLTYEGVRGSHVDCDAQLLGTDECAFMEETARQTSFEQLAAAIGLATCAAGLGVVAGRKSAPQGAAKT